MKDWILVKDLISRNVIEKKQAKADQIVQVFLHCLTSLAFSHLNPSSRENLVMESPYECPLSVQTLGEMGRGVSMSPAISGPVLRLIRFTYHLRSLSSRSC